MSSIYIHIPFCKQACYYCDFHFSTSLKRKPELVDALCKELVLRKKEVIGDVETIYFGGGTPSLLSKEELQKIFQSIRENYTVSPEAEITLEANPDDLSEGKITSFYASGVNRLSIGVQSFFEEDLIWMNRSHTLLQADTAIKVAKQYFDNLSIDLIYGVPGMSDEKWLMNLNKALKYDIPHLSTYALTVEPRTALAKMIQQGKKEHVDDEKASRQYAMLVETLTATGYINYEFSNFGRAGYFSRNNTAYWFGKPYVGIGPSAHGFDGTHRYWNVRHNLKYIQAINRGNLPSERETLTPKDRYNEYIMTRLRTIWGVSRSEIKQKFGDFYVDFFEQEARALFAKGLLVQEGDTVRIATSSKFLGDGISAELFFLGTGKG